MCINIEIYDTKSSHDVYTLQKEWNKNTLKERYSLQTHMPVLRDAYRHWTPRDPSAFLAATVQFGENNCEAKLEHIWKSFNIALQCKFLGEEKGKTVGGEKKSLGGENKFYYPLLKV